MRSSSSRPSSGDLSTEASARSSSGSMKTSPSAMRSCTAICSVSTSRSAPATLMSRCLRADIIAAANGARLRTRIRMSPAWIGRSSDWSLSPAIEPAADGGGDARCEPHGRGDRALLCQRRPWLDGLGLLALLGLPHLDEPGEPRAVRGVHDRCAGNGHAGGLLRGREYQVDRLQQWRDGPERQREGHVRHRNPASCALRANASPVLANFSGSAPWKP